MNWKKITVIFIFAMIGSIAVYDVLAINGGGKEASISWTMIQWSYQYPMFTLAFGVVIGHLFWRMKKPTQDVCPKCGHQFNSESTSPTNSHQ